jgi:hypothetical protein
VEQQQVLRSQKYRYQPRDPLVRAHYQQHGPQGNGEGQEHKK